MSIKKQTVIYVFAILLALSIAVICLAAKEAKQDIDEPAVSASAVEGKTIIVDAGHGGFDAGASANGIAEKDLNLRIALKLKDCINEMGGNAVLTRETDCSTADESRADGTTAKASDLKRRKAMADENNADIFVSIHMNKFEQSQYWGAQVFYADTDESRRLGETIQKALPEVLNDENDRVAKKSDGSIFLLRNVSVPSVIIECGFLSNVNEAEKLKNEEYQGQMAKAICTGIEAFFNNIEPK